MMTVAARSLVEVVALTGAQASLLALVALAITRVGRLRPGWQAAVWLVVLLKFVLPWGPAMPWSLADALAALRDHQEGSAPLVVGRGGNLAAMPHASVLWLVVAAAWAVGAAIVLTRALLAQHRVMVAARRAPRAPEHARHILAQLTRTPPQLVIGADDVGPHVVGVFRPIIVIPSALLADRLLLRAALLHELAHVRRRDALARIAQIVAGALFFFWPVVRIANRRFDLAREAACDAWALETGNLPRPSYARLLVRMTQLRTAPAASLAAPHSLDARVAAVLGPPAHARLGWAHWLGIAAWAALALGGARTAAARGNHVACKYTPQLAEALRQAHPEADLDGDGVLSRDEACEFQAELRRWATTPENAEQVSRLDEIDESLLTQPLCCNCSDGAEHSAPWITEKRSDACQSEGVSQ
jgi:beta-lactamase regulating signal transducer with metallopeptidase domain